MSSSFHSFNWLLNVPAGCPKQQGPLDIRVQMKTANLVKRTTERQATVLAGICCQPELGSMPVKLSPETSSMESNYKN